MELTGPWKTISQARQLRQQMSLPERLLWNALRKKQTGLRFRRQHPAGIFILDFYCDGAKLCVEVGGQQHDFWADHDARRDQWLKEQGISTLRISAKDVLNDLDAVVRFIVNDARPPLRLASLGTSPRGGGVKIFCESNDESACLHGVFLIL